MSLRVHYEILNQKGTPAFFSDTYANRPAFGFAGRVFISTDTGQIFEDTGSAWTLIADAGVGGGTLASVTANGNSTATGIVITAGGLSTDSLTDTALTSGSVLFSGTGGLLSQKNANLFWDNTNNRLGINTASPSASLDIHGTGTLVHLNGTTTNNSYLLFQNAGTGKWRIGNTYNAGANSFDLYNNGLSSTALSFNSTTNLATFSTTIRAVQTTGTIGSQYYDATQGWFVGYDTTQTDNRLIINFDSSYGTSSVNAVQITKTGDFKIPNGNLLVGTNNLFVDKTNTKIGINTLTSLYELQLVKTGTNAFFGISNQGTSNGNRQLRMGFGGNGSDTYASFQGTRYNTADDVNIVFQSGGGNFLIGSTTDNGNKLQITGSCYVSNLGTGLVYSNGGTLTSTNPSDERLKNEITDINWGLNEIIKLRPVTYFWKNDRIKQGVQFGFIAQEVQKVMPEAIKDIQNKYLGLDKDAIYITLVKAIQELNEKLERNNIN